MNKLILLVLAAALAAAGCGTTDQSFMADTPLPIAKGEPATTTVDPVRLTAGRLSADDINDENVPEAVAQLEGEIRADKRTMSKVGK